MRPDAIGPFQIERELGRGGMGEVFLARDSRLDRQVAIKALPSHLAQDPERLARFQREAKVLASLNHPGIGAIYGVEEVHGHQYLILEFVEGETLADRLLKGPIAVDESLSIARQIAEALEFAHEKGIIHRDLKPGNVMVTPDGVVKVLDFGLARMSDGATASDFAPDSPTMPAGSPTMPGAIMGTAGYMSPEQARGKPVDKRSDIFSFGCMLYEMLTGSQAFRGETAADAIGATLHKPVDFTSLPPTTPPMVRHLLRRCLERDRAQRYRDIADVRIEIEDARDTPASLPPIPARKRTLALGAVGLLLAVGAVGVTVRGLFPARIAPHDPEVRRYTITLPPDAPLAPVIALPFAIDRPVLDLSRDGRRMVYVAGVQGGTRLYLRDMGTGVYTALAGTEGGFSPFFSPDGRSVGYFAGEKLMRINLEDAEPARVLADAASPWGGFWATDGNIYFTPNLESPIQRVPAGGGAASAVSSTEFSGSGSYEGFPFVTDDGATLLYSAMRNFTSISAGRTVRVANLATGTSSLLPLDGVGPRLRANDVLLFNQGDRLMAVRLDRGLTTVAGDPVGMLGGIRGARIGGQWAMSDEGTLVYASGSVKIDSRFVWVDREGKREPLLIPPGEFRAFSLSPDARRVAVPIARGGGWDIWLFDLDRPQSPRRITFDRQCNHPIWSADGRWLLFATYPGDGTSRIEVQDLESSAKPFVVHQSPRNIVLNQYDQAAGELLFSEVGEGTFHDIKVATLDLSTGVDARLGEARTITGTRHNEFFARISPDRRSLAFTSDETGRWEVYVASFPDLRGRIRVSGGGGEEMRWSRDGTKIIYRWGNAWYESDLAFTPTISSTPPRLLFKGPFFNPEGISWDATPDWSRFLLLEEPEQERLATTLEVVTGFDAEIRRRLPRNGAGASAPAR